MKFKNIPKVHLEENEKKVLLNKLLDFLEKNPVRKPADGRLIDWTLTTHNMYKLITRPLSILIALFITVSGASALAAQGSVPGDVLYPYKIHVNENVRALFAVSDESKAKLALELAKERLQEAEALASEGKLNAEANSYLQSEFKSELKKHEDTLVKIKEDSDNEENSAQIEDLLDEIKSNTPDVQAAAEGKLTAAENKLAETMKFVEKKLESITAETKTEADAKVAAAQSLITSGKAELENGNYDKAFDDFKASIEASQEAKAVVNDEDNEEED